MGVGAQRIFHWQSLWGVNSEEVNFGGARLGDWSPSSVRPLPCKAAAKANEAGPRSIDSKACDEEARRSAQGVDGVSLAEVIIDTEPVVDQPVGDCKQNRVDELAKERVRNALVYHHPWLEQRQQRQGKADCAHSEAHHHRCPDGVDGGAAAWDRA